MVQIYANFEGLSRKLAQVGILKSPGELQAFARGFNYAHALINFNDVGSGKERADHKIKGGLTRSLFSPQWQIVLHMSFSSLNPLLQQLTTTTLYRNVPVIRIQRSLQAYHLRRLPR